MISNKWAYGQQKRPTTLNVYYRMKVIKGNGKLEQYYVSRGKGNIESVKIMRVDLSVDGTM